MLIKHMYLHDKLFTVHIASPLCMGFAQKLAAYFTPGSSSTEIRASIYLKKEKFFPLPARFSCFFIQLFRDGFARDSQVQDKPAWKLFLACYFSCRRCVKLVIRFLASVKTRAYEFTVHIVCTCRSAQTRVVQVIGKHWKWAWSPVFQGKAHTPLNPIPRRFKEKSLSCF